MSSRQHYLSRCIIKNFITNENNMFFEYDCANKTIQTKNIKKLFSGYRLWNDDFENIIAQEIESKLSLVLKKYIDAPIEYRYFLGQKGIITPQFHGFQIQDEYDRKILSNLFLQQILVQQMNANSEEKIPNQILTQIFNGQGLEMQYPVLFEITKCSPQSPLILVDGILFFFIAPDKNPSKIGHMCFMCPISTKRFIIWGDKNDCDFFARKFSNIDYLNLCMIEQQNKECKIASQNKDYINWLIGKIHSFNSGESARITACRHNPK